jgi:hypothetical protein
MVIAVGAMQSTGQQVTINTPFRTLNNSFFEQNGLSWGGNWRGMNFSFGNANLANPQFGGYQANAGLNTNYAISGPHGQVNFSFFANQGARQSLVTQTPSVTVMNGQTGYFSDTSQTPFVISQIPVVGAFPGGPMFNPWPYALPPANSTPPWMSNPRVQAMQQARADAQAAAADGTDDGVVDAPAPQQRPAHRPVPPRPNVRAMNVAPEPAPAAPDVVRPGGAGKLIAAQASSAGRAAPSVAEARRLHEKEKAAADGDLRAILERGIAAEEDGKPGAAKVYYQMVIRRADGALKAEAQERLDALRGGGSP